MKSWKDAVDHVGYGFIVLPVCLLLSLFVL